VCGSVLFENCSSVRTNEKRCAEFSQATVCTLYQSLHFTGNLKWSLYIKVQKGKKICDIVCDTIVTIKACKTMKIWGLSLD
jgi:hypothetical protein